MKTTIKNQFFSLLFLCFFSGSLLSSPDLEKKYFADWNHPYGAVLPADFLNQTWATIHSLKSENDFDNPIINNWRQIGPFGSTHIETGARFSGRIVDIEVGNSVQPLVASASGGLWTYLGFLPVCISGDLTSLACGAFATDPNNANIVLLGTGEPSVRGGTGLYRSTNSGNLWTKINMGTDPDGFYKIKYQTSSIVHMSTTLGYYRSTNSGINWVKTLDGNITDFDYSTASPSVIYAGKKGDGVYKSTNGGVNWSKVTTPGMPTTDVGRTAVSVGTSNTNRIAVSIVKQSDNTTHGVYLSENNGASWSNQSPPEAFHGRQGWYNNVISICPSNSNIILVGGVRLWRTVYFGKTWTQIDDDNVHADQHAMEWAPNGTTLYLGNDGGLTVSSNQGSTFSTLTNYFPITQYVNIDIGLSNRGVIYGGSQDNGITGTTNGGISWIFTKGGDGGGIAIDPFSSLYIYATSGYWLGSWAFLRYKSTNQGLTWTETNTGVDPSDQWYTKMRSDRNTPLKLYHNSSGFVYTSADNGSSWTKLNNTSFPADINDISVTKYSPSGTVIYAALNSTTSGQRLRVYDGGTFYERSTGLPSGEYIRRVATHITNNTTAYALINGFSNGQKIFKTTNKGVNWVNITGDLPDVPLGDLVPHLTDNNKLYLGTQMGCYRTTNAGVNWHRWNNGMPEANIVTEMKWIDSTLQNGKFYVVAGTFGRSIWVRDISGDDPIGIVPVSNNIPERFQLNQNYPNPFNPVTNIIFDVAKTTDVKLVIYDLLGKEVETLVNKQMQPGTYKTDWNAAEFPSGIYFYKLTTEDGFVETKKMILVK
jgi:photosystem II stability/assembly factor-like uncharacterized protein